MSARQVRWIWIRNKQGREHWVQSLREPPRTGWLFFVGVRAPVVGSSIVAVHTRDRIATFLDRRTPFESRRVSMGGQL